jgi:glyoxylase-like metal-dependent hydrolase (beta-lactamase superfamily II)
MTNRLQWDVLVRAQIPVVTSDIPPGASEMKWSPISSTLISGKRDAVLVDTAITVDQNQKLVDWIAHSGKNLAAIYATHGHGDHFFGRKHNPEEISEGAVSSRRAKSSRLCESRRRFLWLSHIGNHALPGKSIRRS